MEIGKRIKDLRNEKNYSQEDLAKLLKVRRTAISRWELAQNEPDLNTVVNLAKIFDVTTDYLLGLEN